MSLLQEIPSMINHIKANNEFISHSNKMFNISEGGLADYVKASLEAQLNPRSYKSAVNRIAPINVHNKLVSKASKVYAGDVKRLTENPSDQELIDYYVNKGVNSVFIKLNEGYNRYKCSTIELYEHEFELKSRAIPSNMFIAYSNDKVDPLNVTAIIKFMGTNEDDKNVYWAYSKDEFVSFTENGEIIRKDMEENEGLNPFETLNFVYANKSDFELVPRPDKDDFEMTVLLPVILTDLNFAAKHLAHGVYYGVDLDIANLEINPDSFLGFKSDEDGRAPQIGTLKPEVSIVEMLQLINDSYKFWVEQKGIKVSGISSTAENIASGVSKMIDEADVTKDNKMQESYFKKIERDYWRKLAKIHNDLASAGRITNRQLFSDPENLKVSVIFGDQAVIEERKTKVERLALEVEAGFMSKRRSISTLNPEMTPDQIDELIQEIEEESTLRIGADGLATI